MNQNEKEIERVCWKCGSKIASDEQAYGVSIDPDAPVFECEVCHQKWKLEQSWNAIKEYILRNKPELWDEDLDTTFRTVVLD